MNAFVVPATTPPTAAPITADCTIAVVITPAATPAAASSTEEKKSGTTSPPPKKAVAPAEITQGCTVILNGRVHRDSYGSNPGKTFSNYKGKVNLINTKGTHPYHVTTPEGSWLGWVTKESVVLA